jgi:hemolysin activation/secretion protein
LSGVSLAVLVLALSVPMSPQADQPAPASSPASATAPSTTSQSAPASPSKPMEIDEYAVKGTQVLSPEEVEAAVYPFLGPDKTAADVEGARAALEKAYMAKGYQTVAVSIPPQQVNNGVVTLVVTEGKVGRLRVKGSKYHDIEAIKKEAPSLAEGKVPDFNAVSHDIVALNQQPDRKVTPTLRAGATPGTVDADLTVEDQFPLHGSLEMNNRYSADTTHLRLNGMLRYDNLWQMGHSLSVSFQLAPENPSDAEVFSGSYLIRVPGWDKVSFLVYGVDQNSTVKSLATMNVVGKGQIIGGRAIVTLPGEEGFFESLSTGIDYKNFNETVEQGASGSYEAPITYYPISTTWSGTWQGPGSLTQVNAGVTFGFRGMGSGPADFDAKRYKAQGDFIYFRGDASHTHDIVGGMQVFGRLQGQVANAPLVSNEEFAAGGEDTVRGYLESEVLGDSAVLGTLELRSPSLSRWVDGKNLNEWRFFVFGDGGEATVQDPLPEEHARFAMASVGVGTRVRLLDTLNGSVDVAVPFTTQNPTKRYDPRVTFRVWTEF